MNSFVRKNWVALLSLLVSFFSLLGSLYLSHQSNVISNQANDLSRTTFGQNFIYQRYQTSAEMTGHAFDKIWGDPGFHAVYDNLKAGKSDSDYSRLALTFNELEEIGARYCQGLVFEADIRLSFGSILSAFCSDTEVVRKFGPHSNMVAYLCNKIVSPESRFGSLYKTDYTCTPPSNPKELQILLNGKVEDLTKDLRESRN